MEKKKILFVRTVPYDFNPNTYNVQGFGLGKAFCRLGYDFDYLAFTKGEEKEYTLEKINNCRVKVILKKRFRIFRTGICRQICDKNFLSQYDFIISCEYGQYMTYALSKVINNVCMYSGPYYNMFYIPFMSPIYDFLFTKSINRNIKYKFVKSDLAKSYLEKKGYTNVHTIGVALDMDRFNENIKILPETKKIVNYMEKNECLLYVGALSDRKNFPFLLETFASVHKDRPNIRFVMIGKGKEAYVNKYLKKIDEDIKKDILFISKIDNTQLQFVYPMAKAFLLPSKLEIFGMVLLEAMYFKSPVITSRNGGSVTLIKNCVNGQVIDKFDTDLWKNSIFYYLDNKEESEKIVENAHNLIKEKYNWDYIANKMKNIINIERE